MIKLAFLLFCFSVINSQNQNEINQKDNTQEEIINPISVSDSLQIEDVPDSLNQIKPLPEVRKLDTELKKLKPGEDFFEFKSSLDILKQQVDSLKKVLSTYEEGKGALPTLDEELLNLIKIPQLRHRIELQNGTIVNGEIIEENDLGIIIQTTIGQLAIEKDKIVNIKEDLPPMAKVELIDAFKELKKNKDSINEKNLKKYLQTKNIPDPDILIRTGNTNRLSNFLLWQLAYSEIFFEKKLWPDFNQNDYNKIIKKYKGIKRNFGNI